MSDQTYAYQLDAPVSRPPQTVVSLVPSITESLFDLNLGDRLLAITDYCVHPAERVAYLPRIGGTKNPDVQAIIDLAPQIVMANQEENRREDIEALAQAGIPVWVTFPCTVHEAINLLFDIMNVFDRPELVPAVRLMEQNWEWLQRAHDETGGPPCRVFAPIWWEPLMTFNQDTYIHDLLRVCGAENVFADRERAYPLAADQGEAEAYPPDDARVAGRDTRYPRVTVDEVVEAQPDMILLPSEPYEFSQTHVEYFKTLDVPAAHDDAILLVDGSLLTWHGTRLARALSELPHLLCQ